MSYVQITVTLYLHLDGGEFADCGIVEFSFLCERTIILQYAAAVGSSNVPWEPHVFEPICYWLKPRLWRFS